MKVTWEEEDAVETVAALHIVLASPYILIRMASSNTSSSGSRDPTLGALEHLRLRAAILPPLGIKRSATDSIYALECTVFF